MFSLAACTETPLYVVAHPSRSPLSLISRMSSQRPAAVKGAPGFGAAKRTLDGEDRCGSWGGRGRGARRQIWRIARLGIIWKWRRFRVPTL